MLPSHLKAAEESDLAARGGAHIPFRATAGSGQTGFGSTKAGTGSVFPSPSDLAGSGLHTGSSHYMADGDQLWVCALLDPSGGCSCPVERIWASAPYAPSFFQSSPKEVQLPTPGPCSLPKPKSEAGLKCRELIWDLTICFISR